MKTKKPKKPWGCSRFCKRAGSLIRDYLDHHRRDDTRYHWENKHASWVHLETLSHILSCYAAQHVTYGGVDAEWAFEALGLWEMTPPRHMQRRLRIWYYDLLEETKEKSAFRLYDKKLGKYMLGGK